MATTDFQPLLELVESATSDQVIDRLRALKVEENALRALLRMLQSRERLTGKSVPTRERGRVW